MKSSRRTFIKTGIAGTTAMMLAPILVGCGRNPSDIDFSSAVFKPDFDSLLQYKCPDWFRDAKFGIFLHWGVNSVPGFNGHYGRYMYWQEKPDPVEGTGWSEQATDVYPHHVETYGHPTEFGYKDFIPMWKAEKFDAGKLAAFFKSIGARYVVPMAVHHDNFDNWDSKYHRWNSVKMGPKIDIIGEWKKACAENKLRFGVSSHFNGGHENVFFQGGSDASGPLAGVPYDTMDPKYDDFYHRRTPDRKKILPYIGEEFLNRHIDLVESYQPDLLYFDGGLPYEENGLKLAAHFYNENMKNNEGKLDCVLALKRNFPEGAATLDIEKGQADRLREEPWQTDTTINDGWFYLGKQKAQKYKKVSDNPLHTSEGAEGEELRMDAELIIDNLVDIVSKNGNLLLNIGPRADGSIPEIFVDELKKIGKWLDLNGEAIYETRPWIMFGEGPTQIKTGYDSEPDKPWSKEDIRFTTKENVLYAIPMDWPDGKKFTVKSLHEDQAALGEIKSVSLLGHEVDLEWKRHKEGLTISLPEERPCEYAYVFKIEHA